MTDTINLTDQLAGFNPASAFERTAENNPDQADEVARPGRRRGRGQLRAAFARERQSPRPAFLVELSQRARRTAETRETEAAAEPDRAAEAAPRGRAALRQQFQQARQTFLETNRPGQAGGGGEGRGGVVTIPAGLERGARQGGGRATAGAAAAPAAARTPERPGSQAGAQPAVIANREPPRLDGVRMAASFEFTALGNALRMNRGPANVAARPAANAANQGLAVGSNTNRAARPGTTGGTPLAAGGNTGGNQLALGPLSRVERRQENPGNNLLNTDQRSPLAADRVAVARGRIGNAQLEQRPVVGRVNPGQADESDNALGAGIGTENINRYTGQANTPGNNQLVNPNTDIRFLSTLEQPPARANAAPERIMTDDRRTGGGLVGPEQAPAPPQQAVAAMGANRLAGAAAEEPGERIGGNTQPAAAPTAGITPPANPLEPEAPSLFANEPEAPLDGNPGQVVPRLADVQGAVATEPEQPTTNPAPPAAEPTETPTERAAAVRATPAEAADAELRATIPTPIEPPPGAVAREAPAAPPGPAETNPAVARPAGGAAGQAGGPVGAPETPLVPRTGFPAEAGEEAENAPGVVPAEAAPPEAAPPGVARGRPTQAGPAENPANEAGPLAPRGEEGEEFEQVQARAVAAYELQQMENRTNEPNEGRTVTEQFIR